MSRTRKQSTLRRKQLVLSLFPYAMLAGSAVYAQEPPEQPVTLDKMIVTAQKREEEMMDVPMSIAAFTPEMLDDMGAADLADFIQTVPGVDIDAAGDGALRVHMRGISTGLGDALVGFYLDELPFTFLGLAQSPDVRTFDLERVEVLRGPQGTLYGDGSLGGTIRLLTAKPDMDEFQAKVDLSAKSTQDGEDSYAANAMINVPIQEDVLGLRLVATTEELGGWIDNTLKGVEDSNDREIDTFRAKLRLTPTDKLDVTLSAWHSEQTADDNSVSTDDRTKLTDPTINAYAYDLFSATVEYEFAAFDLLSATSVMDAQFDQEAFFGLPFVQNDDQDILSQELRLTSFGSGAFRWTSGLFYRKMERDSFQAFGPFAPTILTGTSESWALFGEGTWSLLDDRMEVILGLRYFEDDREFDQVVDAATLARIQAIDPTFTGREAATFDSISPRFNLAYHLNEDWLLYTNIAKGFRSGQMQNITQLIAGIDAGIAVPVSIEEESLWSYEIGSKTSFAGGRVVLEGAVYYNDWSNVQTQITVDQASGLTALINGGPARSMGIELSAQMQPVEGLSVRLTGGYTNAEYREDVAGTPIRAGDRVIGIPEITAAASASYRWPLGSTLHGFVNGGVQYSSDRVEFSATALRPPSDEMTTFDLRIGVESEQWGVYLFGENLTDEDGAYGAPTSTDPLTATASRLRPRTFGVNLRYDFN